MKKESYKYYEREINYYETDKMGVVHHSNYARLLEESRISMLKYYDLPYDMLEDMGYMIPVLELHSHFGESIKFGETVRIVPKLDKVSAVKFYISYKIYDETMTHVKHTAESVHCFLDRNFKPVSLKKVAPELFKKLTDIVEVNEDDK